MRVLVVVAVRSISPCPFQALSSESSKSSSYAWVTAAFASQPCDDLEILACANKIKPMNIVKRRPPSIPKI